MRKEDGGAIVGAYKPMKAIAAQQAKTATLGAGTGGFDAGKTLEALGEDLDITEIGAVIERYDPVLTAILAGEV